MNNDKETTILKKHQEVESPKTIVMLTPPRMTALLQAQASPNIDVPNDILFDPKATRMAQQKQPSNTPSQQIPERPRSPPKPPSTRNDKDFPEKEHATVRVGKGEFRQHFGFLRRLKQGKGVKQGIALILVVIVGAYVLTRDGSYPSADAQEGQDAGLSRKQMSALPKIDKKAPTIKPTIPVLDKKAPTKHNAPETFNLASQQQTETPDSVTPESFASTKKLAVAALISGRYEEAIPLYKRLLEIEQHNEAFLSMIKVLEQKGNKP